MPNRLPAHIERRKVGAAVWLQFHRLWDRAKDCPASYVKDDWQELERQLSAIERRRNLPGEIQQTHTRHHDSNSTK